MQNIEKSIRYIHLIRPTGYMNLVAIHPTSKEVRGITRPSKSKDLYIFIKAHYDDYNLYYTVNEPFANAPDEKLRKEHIEFVHALYIDKDPSKLNDFESERIKLLEFAKELNSAPIPPSYTIDSGNGVQAIWFLKEKLSAENETEFEEYGRGLAKKFNSDAVQNIDRIFRLPYTKNLPNAKKIELGRKQSESSIIHYSKNPYSWDDLKSLCEPVKLQEYDSLPDVDLDLDSLPKSWEQVPELKNRFDSLVKEDLKLQRLLTKEIIKPSRSEYDFSAAQILKSNDWNLTDAATALRLSAVGKGMELTKRDIVRAYNRAENVYLSMALSDEEINLISTQSAPQIETIEEVEKTIEIDSDDFNQEWESGAKMDWKTSAPQLFKNLMGLGEVGCIYGVSNIGKSFIAIDIAGHLAMGKDWAGFKLKTKGSAYILAAEGSGGYKKRISGLKRRLGLPENVSDKDFPLILHRKQLDLVGDVKTKSCPDLDKLIAQIKHSELKLGIKHKLVIIDTLAAVFGGKNENDAADASRFIMNMQRLAYEVGATVIFVHHEGKSAGTGLRGSSALTGNIDFIFEVKETKFENAVKKEFIARKQKDSDKNISIEFKLPVIELGKDEDGDGVTTCFINLSTDLEFMSVIPDPTEELELSQFLTYIALKIASTYFVGDKFLNSRTANIIEEMTKKGLKDRKEILDFEINYGIVWYDLLQKSGQIDVSRLPKSYASDSAQVKRIGRLADKWGDKLGIQKNERNQWFIDIQDTSGTHD